jgi:uncharacterized protein (DUF2236 family)
MPRNPHRLLRDLLAPPSGMGGVDFTAPPGAPALLAADSVSWRIMKNPLALFIGGVAAVILELAEPRVRSGVWEHTSFRRDPVMRMRRTGYAAMATIYAPAEQARTLIAGVVRAHERVTGVTPAGAPYSANDPELLDWVQATASFGFLYAYHRYVRPLSAAERDRYFAEGGAASALYGATGAPNSEAEWEAQLAAMLPKLERSDIVFEFLDIVRKAPVLPSRTLQRLAVRGAIAITPAPVRERLGLERGAGPLGDALLKLIGAAADRIPLEAPPAQAARRMGMKARDLYR